MSCFKLCFFCSLCLALTSWLSPNWTQKRVFFGHLSCQKNPKKTWLHVWSFHRVPACQCFPSMTYFLWGMRPCLSKQTALSQKRLLCSLSPPHQICISPALWFLWWGAGWGGLFVVSSLHRLFFFNIVLFYLGYRSCVFKKESEQLSPSLAKALLLFLRNTNSSNAADRPFVSLWEKKHNKTYWICLEVLRDADENPTGLTYLPQKLGFSLKMSSLSVWARLLRYSNPLFPLRAAHHKWLWTRRLRSVWLETLRGL